MYNLDVAVADTFYVGEEQWLVHNGCDWGGWKGGTSVSKVSPAAAELAEIAHEVQMALPKDLRNLTVGAGYQGDVLKISLSGETMGEAYDFLTKNTKFSVLPIPKSTAPDFHVERQLTDIGITTLGISRRSGLCDPCQSYYNHPINRNVEIGVYGYRGPNAR